MRKQRIDKYGRKKKQSKLYREQEQECHVWMSQNLNPGKTAAVVTMLERMVEIRSWKEARWLIDDGRCQICNQHSETVEHLVVGCTKLANSEYLTRHNRALMILAVAWAKQQELRDHEAICINKDGIEEWCQRMIKQSWYGTSSSTYEKPQLQEDQT